MKFLSRWCWLAFGLHSSALSCAHRELPPETQVKSVRSPKGQELQPFEPIEKEAQILSPLCLHGCPELLEKRENQLIRREIYLLSNNKLTKLADWVAYRVTKTTIGKSKRRNWKADPDIAEADTLEPEDYRGANRVLRTDRGHQVPLASFSGTKQWRQLNYMSNISPQKGKLNQQIWKRLEQRVRKLAREPEVEAVYVITGPLFEREMPPLPGANESHEVPSGYFKVVAITEGESLRVAAFIMDQETPGSDSHCDYGVTVHEVESRAQLDFFVALPDAREGLLESRKGDLYFRLGCEMSPESSAAPQAD